MGKATRVTAVAALAAAQKALLAIGCGSNEAESGESTAAVKPSSSAVSLEAAEAAALEKYRWHLERNAVLLVDWTKQLWGQIVAGEVAKAQSRYATSRVQYGHLLPFQGLVPALDLRINGQRDEQKGSFIGFHRIELSLFQQESAAGLKPIAKSLVEDAQKLRRETKTVALEPAHLASATEQLLKEVASEKLAGEEEPYSEVDLVDVSAAVEGAEAAFEALRPATIDSDPGLALEVEAEFAGVYEQLSELGTPGRQPQAREPAAGAIFVGFGEVANSNIKQLTKSVQQLGDSFKAVAQQLPASSSSASG
jgi:iron uptake system component EfeO